MNRLFISLIFLIVIFGVYGGLHYYIYRRLLHIIPGNGIDYGDAADVDGNGSVNIRDIQEIVRIIIG